MNFRPYPKVDRALHQVERGRVPEPQLWNPLTTTGRELGEAFRAAFTHLRRAAKTTITVALADQAVKAGGHVHIAGRDGVRCAGGDPACSLPSKEPERPIVLARVIRTCSSNPAQWDAWTTDGTYVYLRYRFGVGTVSASPYFRAAPLVRFEHGGRYSGSMDLDEFLTHSGLQLADNAEVTGE